MRPIVLAIFLLCLASPAAALPAWLVRVVDGDTLEIRYGRERETVRIFGIDAPEQGQPGGFQAKLALAALVGVAPLDIVPVDRDRYGRLVARVEAGSRDIGLAMVRSGHAWQFTRYDDGPTLGRAQMAAQADGRGVWADPAALPPWDWRARTRARASLDLPADCRPAPRCGRMTSCAQAVLAVTRCSAGRLDGDQDGIPCEALCQPSG